jgi:hypothetical protein
MPIAGSFRSGRVGTALVAAVIAIGLIGGDPSSNAGIQGSGRASISSFGRITGLALGHVEVQGIDYATSQAQIRINDAPAAESALQLGQVVLIQGTLNADGASARATQVAFDADVQGTVTQINEPDRTFAVLGQTVRVTDTTLFGDGIQPAGIEGLQTGSSVQVSGFTNAEGELVASSIAPVLDTSSLRIRGTVKNLDTASRTFSINALPVDYSGATLKGPFAAGAVAQVLGFTTSPEGVLVASSIKASKGIGAAANDRAAVEGIITSFTSPASFSVNGQSVTTDSSTKFSLRGGTLGLNAAVEVTGLIDADGALVSTRVEVQPRGFSTANAASSAAQNSP